MASAKDMINQDRGFIYDRGNRLNQIAGDRGDNAYGQENYYQQYGDEVYDPLIGGRGGYSEDEKNQIMGGDLGRYNTSDDDLNSNYISDQEGAAIQGNAADRMKYFDPDTENAYQDTSELRQRDAVNQMEGGLNSAIDPSKLSLSDQYGKDASGALNGMEGNVQSDISRDRLAQDPTLANRYRMTDQDVENQATAAGTTVGNALWAQQNQAGRAARGAGVDPLGVATLQQRVGLQAAGEAGDAMTRARAQAKQEQAQREMNLEQNRQDAERGYSGLRSAADLQVGQAKLGQANQGEQMRLGSQQDISNRRMGAAQASGQARIGSEEAMRQQEMNQRQYNTTTGLQMAKDIDDTNSNRAKYMTENRQGVNAYNQGTRYQQGMAANQLTSQRAQSVANERLGEAAEGRSYLRGQEGLKSGEQQAESNRQAAVYGTQGGLLNQTQQTQNTAEYKPTTFDKIMGAAGGVMQGVGAMGFRQGGVVTEPTNAILGENGPEMVVPLGNGGQAGQAQPIGGAAPSPSYGSNNAWSEGPTSAAPRQFRMQTEPGTAPIPTSSPTSTPAAPPTYGTMQSKATSGASKWGIPQSSTSSPFGGLQGKSNFQSNSATSTYSSSPQSRMRLRGQQQPMQSPRFNQPYRPLNQPQPMSMSAQ